MTEPSIVVTRRWPDAVEHELRRRYPNVQLNSTDEPFGDTGIAEALREADVLLPTVSDRIPAELLSGPVRTRFIGNFGAGFEHIDLVAARAAGIVVTNTPGVLTDTTADVAILLMLMVARRAGEGQREIRAGGWSGWRPTHLLGAEVTGKTLGVIGMGRIGSAVARRAHFGFGMPVVFHNRSTVSGHGVPGARQLDTVEEVLATADFVTLHMPGGAGAPPIDAGRLAGMKPTAFLINTARGDVVDEQALIDALARGTIAGAGLDVYEHEPHVPEALRQLDNAVLLPHLGSATIEARTAMGMLVLDNLEAFLAGTEPPNRV